MTRVPQESNNTLYERLGGYDAIVAIVDDFLDRMRTTPLFACFGGGRSLDSIQRTRQLIVDQLCALLGGPCVYSGRDMRTSHAGPGITPREWEATIGHIAVAVASFKVPAQEKADFIGLFERYRDEIVEGGTCLSQCIFKNTRIDPPAKVLQALSCVQCDPSDHAAIVNRCGLKETDFVRFGSNVYCSCPGSQVTLQNFTRKQQHHNGFMQILSAAFVIELPALKRRMIRSDEPSSWIHNRRNE